MEQQHKENGSGSTTRTETNQDYTNYRDLDPNGVFKQALDALDNEDINLFKELVPQVKEAGELNNYFAIDGAITKETLLHYAAQKGFKDAVVAVNTLIEAGSDITLKNGFGETPVQVAARAHKNLDVFETLIKRNISNGLSSKDSEGNGLVHLISGNYDDVQKFLDLVLDLTTESVNQQNNDGNTPLHVAARWNNYEYVKVLLANPDTDTSITNNNGETAYEVAKDNCIGGRGRNPCENKSIEEFEKRQSKIFPGTNNKQKPLSNAIGNDKFLIPTVTVSFIAIITALAVLVWRRRPNRQLSNQRNMDVNNPETVENVTVETGVSRNQAAQDRTTVDIEMQGVTNDRGNNQNAEANLNPQTPLGRFTVASQPNNKGVTDTRRTTLARNVAKKPVTNKKKSTSGMRIGA